MAGVYRLDLRNTSGTLLAQVLDFDWLACTTRVNSGGSLQFGVHGEHSLLSLIDNRYQVELYRADPTNSVDWTLIFGGQYLGNERREGEGRLATATLTVRGYLGMLHDRIVAWASGTANRSKFTAVAAETIMKTLVSYNAGSSATVLNGRIREGAITGLSVAADGGGGNSLDYACAFEDLLETLQKLARVAGGDFDLVKTAAASWEFRWYTGQRGTDRSADVIFALERGNMGSPVYRKMRTGEKTVAIVGGQETGAARVFEVRTGTDYAAGNNSEFFLSAVDVVTAAGLQDRGDRALDERRSRDEFGFEVLQTPGCMYGVHYVLGDLVTAINPYTGTDMTQQIKQVIFGLGRSGEENLVVQVEER